MELRVAGSGETEVLEPKQEVMRLGGATLGSRVIKQKRETESTWQVMRLNEAAHAPRKISLHRQFGSPAYTPPSLPSNPCLKSFGVEDTEQHFKKNKQNKYYEFRGFGHL